MTMRERQMREHVERFLERQMRKTMMPAALGLGLALTDCRSPMPPDAGPPAGSEEVEGELRRPDGVAVYSAPVSPRFVARGKYDTLYAFGAQTWDALDRCDFSFLRGAILSRGDLLSVSAGPPDEQSYSGIVDAWLEKLKQDFCTPLPTVPPELALVDPQAPARCGIAGPIEVQDVQFAPAGTEWKRRVALGQVTAYVLPRGEHRWSQAKKLPPLTFIDFQDRWRLLVK
jgi:hypothetical protein